MLKSLSLLIAVSFLFSACGGSSKKGAKSSYRKGSSRYYSQDGYRSLDDIIYDNLGHRSGSGVYYAHHLTTSKEFDIPYTRNKYVDKWIDYFTGRGRAHFERYLTRLGRFMPYIQKVLDQYNMPRDIVFLSMIESGFNIRARSWASAAGPWQFIRSTGAMYGLDVDYYVDERRDVEKSTHAAARHLKDLYNDFGHWYLAFAAYNAGAAKVRGAIARDGSDYWDMVRGRYLRQETKDYVPKILAAAIISKDPEKYGFRHIDYQAPVAYDVVTVDGPTDLEVAAECSGVDPDLIRLLNPELLRDMTPPNVKGYQLKIPHGTKDRFQRIYANLRPSQRMRIHYYTVARGDTVEGIAKQYGVSASDLAAANRGEISVHKSKHSKRVKVSYRRRGKRRTKWVKKHYTVASYRVSSGAKLTIPNNRSLASYSSFRDDEAAYRAQDKYPIQVVRSEKEFEKKSKKDKKEKVEKKGSAPDSKIAAVPTLPGPTQFEAEEKPEGSENAQGPSDEELRAAVAQLPVKSDIPDVEGDPELRKNWQETELSGEATPEAAPAPAPVKAAKKAPAKKQEFYRVRSGDTLIGLSHKFGVGVDQLKHWNGKKVSPVLISGAKIRVGGTQVVKYKVKPGDNLTKIAKAHSTTAANIKKLNGLKGHIIKPGAVLVVDRQ